MPSWLRLPSFIKRKARPLPVESRPEPELPSFTPWWRTELVDDNESRFWKIGEQIICLDRYRNEWHSAHWNWTTVNGPALPTDKLNFKTVVIRNQNNEVSLKPILANRSVISELHRAIDIPGGEKIQLYVSSPLWCQVTVGKTHVLVDDIPSQLLSDTWFGTNTLEGELCYADHTHCSQHLDELAYSPERIISPLLIKNKSQVTLTLKHIVVPLPYLSVYMDTHNRLWTEQLVIHRNGDDTPEVHVSKGAPKAIAGNITLLSRPRIRTRASQSIKHLFLALIGRTKR